MTLDFSSLAAGFFFGVWGVYCLKRAKSQGNVTSMLLGLALLVFPYFIETAWITWLIGTGLLVAAYLAR